MKNENIKPITNLPCFRTCITIGELPTSYLESLSYYEGQLFINKYLNEDIIPAINNNAEAIKELQEKVPIIDPTHKLPSDLVSDYNQVNKFVTEEDIDYWNNTIQIDKIKNEYSNSQSEIYSSYYINSLIGDITNAIDLINGEVI